MATVAGAGSVQGVAGSWVNLPAIACENIIFQKGSFDIGFSATPGNNYFRFNSDMAPISVPVIANADTLWIRAGGLIQFLYSSP
jgi:hypothetical protein